ncbi:MAG TPA: tol-pal system-associated acyl-CoA thioesterase [Ideonella sp.]|nr:tol-pal system-associated acyl-CoA thioesterase [Ideonella sp.]
MAFSSFSHPVRVYWEDTDAGGVVFYANYLKFFERARTEWLRGEGFGQQRMVEETGVVFIVTQTHVRYLRPARLDDELRLTVDRAEVGRARLVVEQQAWRGDELLCEGSIHLACVQQGTFRPCRIPTAIFDRLTSDHTSP